MLLVEDSMYCQSCGTNLPEDAAFCMKCGKSTSAQVQSAPRYEVLQIAGKLGFATNEFWAEATGPKGVYVAARYTYSDAIFWHTGLIDENCKKCKHAHTEFVKKLVADGWEPSEERGNDWYALRFRRQVK